MNSLMPLLLSEWLTHQAFEITVNKQTEILIVGCKYSTVNLYLIL